MKKSLIFLIFVFTFTFASAQYIYIVDFSHTLGNLKDLVEVNKGNPYSLGNSYSDIGIDYVRMHDYHGANDYCLYTNFWLYNEATDEFTQINPDFNPNNPDSYNWDEFDNVVNGYDNFGIKMYVRIGTSYPNEQFTLQPMSPPLDPDGINFTNFSELCYRTVMHYNEGWNNGYFYNIEYWEFWNEPKGLFWDGTPEQFYQAYATTSQLLKSEFPQIKIGAPGALPVTTLDIDTSYGIDFLDYLNQNNIPLDFYSWHIYGLMNPYALKKIAADIRSWLDSRNFTEAESHISEINHSLDDFGFQYFENNAKGNAYYTSLIITAQKSSVDKLFWYPGRAFFENDGISYSWTGCGAKAFGLMKNNTPLHIFSSDDIVVEENNDTDTTNVMLLASKSVDNSKLYLLLSNYNSNLDNFSIEIENLPWEISDSIRCIKNITKNPDIKFAESEEVINGGPNMTINISELPAPSTILIRLEKIFSVNSTSDNHSSDTNSFLLKNYPNPFNPTTTIVFKLKEYGNAKLDIFNIKGEKIKTLFCGKVKANKKIKIMWSAKNLDSGIYYYKLTAKNTKIIRKMVLLK